MNSNTYDEAGASIRPAPRQLLDAEAECARLRAALEAVRVLIAAIYTLELLSEEGKKLLLEERDAIDKALAS